MILYPHCVFKDLTEGRAISGVNSATVQDRYSSALAGMDLNHAKCESCGRIGDFSVHGYYRRRIVVMGEVCFVLIMRMKCLGCSGTHAILTADMIPYCRYMTHACLMVVSGGRCPVMTGHQSNLLTFANSWPKILGTVQTMDIFLFPLFCKEMEYSSLIFFSF